MIIPVISIALLALAGCSDKLGDIDLKEQEERYFNLYMDANYPDLEPTSSGLYFIEYKAGTGESPDTGDYLLINYLAYTIPDETVVDTYDEEWAREYNLYVSGVMYGPYKFRHGSEMEGMKEGLSLMKEGGIARLIFKSDLGYGSKGLGGIDEFTSLMYDIELVKVINDVDAFEKGQIAAYLSDKSNYETIFDEETGATMYYIPDVIGDSVQVEEKDKVEIFYTGQLLDGRVFDSNASKTSGFKVRVGNGDVIKGWDIGLPYFRYGGTGQLLIPHELAYGEEGSLAAGTSKASIPPFEALLFDIRVSKTIPE